MKTAPGAAAVGMPTCAEGSRAILTWLLGSVKCDFFNAAASRTLSFNKLKKKKVTSFSDPSSSPLCSFPHTCFCSRHWPCLDCLFFVPCTQSNNSQYTVCKLFAWNLWNLRILRPRHFPQGVENLHRMKRTKSITDNQKCVWGKDVGFQRRELVPWEVTRPSLMGVQLGPRNQQDSGR